MLILINQKYFKYFSDFVCALNCRKCNRFYAILYSNCLNKIFLIGINNPKTTKEPIYKWPSSSSSVRHGPQSAAGSPSRPTPDS